MAGRDDGPRPLLLHVDMDAFYAAVEAREDPRLVDRPLVIGADPKGGRGRGVVSTADYAARRYGIRSAMPISKAWEACPHATFLRPDFQKYKPASRDVMAVLDRYADELEVVGMDEAYLDVTARCGGDWQRVPSLCRSLQAAVKRATGLSCSVGAAPTKSAAKIASDRHKPHGVTVVPPDRLLVFLDPLPVRLVSGCGPKSAQRLRAMGYDTVGDLARADREGIRARFGKHGDWLWNVANGMDPRPVRSDRGPAKSRGNERTFPRDEARPDAVRDAAHRLLDGLLASKRDRRPFATLTIKLRYRDFTTLTRAQTLSIPLDPATQDATHLARATVDALLDPLLDGRAVRLVGVRISNFTDAPGQRSLSAFGVGIPPAAAAGGSISCGVTAATTVVRGSPRGPPATRRHSSPSFSTAGPPRSPGDA